MTQPQPQPQQDGSTWWSWRRSMFAYYAVAHLAEDGQTRRTSDDYPGEQWVWAACGQKVAPDEPELPDTHRCLECLTWWQQQQSAGRA